MLTNSLRNTQLGLIHLRLVGLDLRVLVECCLSMSQQLPKKGRYNHKLLFIVGIKKRQNAICNCMIEALPFFKKSAAC